MVTEVLSGHCWHVLHEGCQIQELLQVLKAFFSLQLRKLGHVALTLTKQLRMNVGLTTVPPPRTALCRCASHPELRCLPLVSPA